MKIDKIRLAIVAVILIILVVCIINLCRKTYKLDIDNKEKVTVVTIKKNTNTNKVEVKAENMVKDAISVITESKIKTKTKYKEVPNVDEYYIVTFDNSDTTLYLYKKGNKCYIEKENDGKYKISNELYDKITKALYI